MALPPRNERHEWLRFDTHGYTKEEKQEFETRLAKIYYRKICRVQTLDFARLAKINKGDGDMDMTERLRMQHKGAPGEVLFTTFVWRELLALSYTLIREPLRRLCHRLIAFTISDRGQTPEKRQQVGAAGGDNQVDPKVPLDAPADQEDVHADLAPE
nr:hypothetical protein [Tanacetum cinerariifolium]